MPDSLTTREIECVHLAGQGLEDKEIAARRLSIAYSEASILISEPVDAGPVDPASAERSVDDSAEVLPSWPLPSPPRGIGARLGVMIAGAVVALLLALGIVTAGMGVPALFDRIAPEWAR